MYHMQLVLVPARVMHVTLKTFSVLLLKALLSAALLVSALLCLLSALNRSPPQHRKVRCTHDTTPILSDCTWGY